MLLRHTPKDIAERQGLTVNPAKTCQPIGAMYAAVGCDIEAVVLTGGMIRAERVRNELRKRVGKLAPVLIFDQPLEMEALAAGALRVLTGASEPIRYLWDPSSISPQGELS